MAPVSGRCVVWARCSSSPAPALAWAALRGPWEDAAAPEPGYAAAAVLEPSLASGSH